MPTPELLDEEEQSEREWHLAQVCRDTGLSAIELYTIEPLDYRIIGDAPKKPLAAPEPVTNRGFGWSGRIRGRRI